MEEEKQSSHYNSTILANNAARDFAQKDTTTAAAASSDLALVGLSKTNPDFLFRGSSANGAAVGLSVRRSALLMGRLPEPSEFQIVPSALDYNNQENSGSSSAGAGGWPGPPPQLYDAVYRRMAALQLPRLV